MCWDGRTKVSRGWGKRKVGIVVSKVVVVVLSTDKEKKGNFKVWYVDTC